ncbi:CoA-binding protein [Helicobacter labacensis]|uniref:CoA-binding protein n=1 Tax=Helicobacter labacensis TaxID=2316079 RepID=UPI000EAD2044|nr:CoA-binding protein [Helicobacter labacensis]
MNAQALRLLLESRFLGIVGLSPDPHKDSHKVGAYLQAQGYHIVPIYPKTDTPILGQAVYATLQEAQVAQPLDGVIVFRKSAAIMPLAQEFLTLTPLPKFFWMQLGITNAQAQELLQAHGVAVVQDHCALVEHHKAQG